MIYYLLESAAAHPDLGRGMPPVGLLNAAEQRQFCALRTAKRQRDWLLGRWTAKRLLQTIVAQELGEYAPLDTFTIINTPNGAPRVRYGLLGGIPLSISHRDDCALCAISPLLAREGQGVRSLGVDLERIEPRTGSFAEDYFTEAELARVRRAPEGAHDLMITAIWSAKEAALKALQVGLTVDTRAVSCLLEPPSSGPATWTLFEICYDVAHLNPPIPVLKGWWRRMEDYVLTCVSDVETRLVTPTHDAADILQAAARGGNRMPSEYAQPSGAWEVRAG